MKMKTKLYKLNLRFTAIYRILFRKYNHWAIINLDDENLVKLLKEEDFTADCIFHGIQSYIFYRMVKKVGNYKSDIDMMLEKAEFEAKASIYKNEN
jgi:hypothetical protein